jgi:DMSO/TMAO reductase YedYZ molybdopterin-dependent catalytic subunit
MKDITDKNFGPFIAFCLPGFILLFVLSLSFPEVKDWLALTPSRDGASIGGFLYSTLPQIKQVTRHICVEGWSAIGSWTGTPLRDFLKLVGADTRAKYCWFQCADKDGYNSPLDMETALHPQTQMTFKFADEILPRAYGFPMKIRVPTKLGFKNPKYVMSIEVTNDYKGGYWEDQGYNSFSGS